MEVPLRVASGVWLCSAWWVGVFLAGGCTNGSGNSCPQDQVSVNGACRGVCNNSRDCPAAQECDPSVGACVPRSVATGSSSVGGSAGSAFSALSGSSGALSSSTFASSRASSALGASSGPVVVSSSAPVTSSAGPPPTGPVCDVDGGLVPAGTGHPQNPCLVCDPFRDPGAWSVVDNGSACGPGRVCVGVACTQGCFVEGAFHAPDGAAPNNPCSTCQPAVSSTSFTALMEGSDCGNGQTCQAGACGTACAIANATIPSGQTNSANPCESCQPGISTTAWTPRADQTRCDADGTVCNGVQRCSAGACVNAEPARACDTPSTCQQANGATCDPLTGACAYPLASDGSACGDGQVCSGGACRAGCVVSGQFVAPGTADPTEPCRTCQPLVSTAAFSPVAGGTSCDDGNACNGVRACSAGVCALQAPAVTCTPGPCQTGGTCNPQTGQCSFGMANNGADCGNGQVCQSGSCGTGCNIGGQPYASGAVNPQNPCQSCQPGVSTTAFSPLGNGAACEDDANVCNGTRTCQNGSCAAAGAPITCTPGTCQTGGTCNAVTGACSFNTASNGDACGAGQVCFEGTCGSGCVIGGVFRANDAINPTNPCQVCKPSVSTRDWSNVSNGTGCDDGDVCNGVNTCQAGACMETTADVVCTPGACQTGGTCNAVSGACSFGAAPNGSGCGSGLVCFGGACGAGCVIGTLVAASGSANPQNPCQRCDPATTTTAWSNQNDGTDCSSSNACEGTRSCQSGTCQQAMPPITCTPGLCQVSSACVPASGQCASVNADDGTPCSAGRACSQGACAEGCFVDGAFRNPGDTKAGNPCLLCDPLASTQAWTPYAGFSLDCPMGQVCQSGACTTGCLIESAFLPENAVNPANPCLMCRSEFSVSSWSSANGFLCTTTMGGSGQCCGSRCEPFMQVCADE